MRLELDTDACTGHGRCYALSPEYFESDDDGYCAGPVGVVPPHMEAAARRGADNCPEGALTIIEEPIA
jgi:ferredoxin